jgi:putative ABC transport system permease protein
VKGNPNKTLNIPFTVVLSQSSAEKYFGDVDPVGNMLLINGKDRAYITGVMEDIPHNSHFRVDMLVSLSTLIDVWNPGIGTRWISARASTYLLLHENANVPSLQGQFPSFVEKHYDQQDEGPYLILKILLHQIYLTLKYPNRIKPSGIDLNRRSSVVLSFTEQPHSPG